MYRRVVGFLISVKRSYFQQSSPGQTEGLKGELKEWGGLVGFEFARGIGGWVGLRNGWMGGLQKSITVVGRFYTYKGGV
jgi:hypothetical protein